VKKFFR